MRIYETELTTEVLKDLITMSACWEAEDITYGYRKNERSDIEERRIFLAEKDGCILGYLMGQMSKAHQANSIMPDGTAYFVIEELYVMPGDRNKGIGGALFAYAEKITKEDGMKYIMLSTATKNYKSILHFYIDEMGMDFWSARLYKRL